MPVDKQRIGCDRKSLVILASLSIIDTKVNLPYLSQLGDATYHGVVP